MGRFNMSTLKGKDENSVEIGKSYLNDASKALASKQKKSEYISMDDIVVHPDNDMSMGKVPWLTQDIALNGLLQPLVVEQQEDGKYKLYAGHQRFAALQVLKKQGKWGEDVEVKVIDLDGLDLPDGISRETREKMALRSTNIQRDKTDADIYREIQDWKQIYEDLRKNGVEVFEYGADEDSGETIKQTIKGVKTQQLVSQQVGISKAQVGKFDKVTNQGSDKLIEALKSGDISVATASDIASKPEEEQDALIEKAKENVESGKMITKDDVLVAEHKLNTQTTSSKKEDVDVETPENKEEKQDAVPEGMTIITDKEFKKDIKEISKALKLKDGVLFDQAAYMNYLKHIQAIIKLIDKAVED